MVVLAAMNMGRMAMNQHSKHMMEAMRFRCPSPHPPLTFEGLCQALSLEITLGQHHAFRHRLLKALCEVNERDIYSRLAKKSRQRPSTPLE
jgi:hypothetical protein